MFHRVFCLTARLKSVGNKARVAIQSGPPFLSLLFSDGGRLILTKAAFHAMHVHPQAQLVIFSQGIG